MRPRGAALLLWGLVCGCPADDKPPGDEVMGTYAFHAVGLSPRCALPDISSEGFDFSGSFSRYRDGGATFLTLNGVPRPASFDGQVASSSHSASRTFPLPDGGDCKSCDMRLVETLTVALVSQTQSERLGDKCPDRPLDGGVPGPDDAGVKLPGSTPTGFDAVRACGELHEYIIGTGTCDPLCNSCRLEYQLTGDRK